MLPLARPDIAFEEVAADIQAILESGMLTRGPYVARFEEAVASYVGCRFAVATTSATTALHLSLVAAGIGAGDEVLVSDFTFPASGNSIVQAGAKPVLVDCLPGRYELDPRDFERKITPAAKAVMVVHPFGHPADMSTIMQVAERHQLLVIEDAACAIGSEIGGRRCGSWGLAGCFSFHPRKILTTGEGGMITTNDQAFADKVRILATHGGVAGNGVGLSFIANGFNYRMSEIQAALGLAQMRRLDAMLADRRQTASRYRERLAGLAGVSIPEEPRGSHCTYQSFVVLLDQGIDRNHVVRAMREAGIETTLGTYAMHAQPAFSGYGYQAGGLKYAYLAQEHSLTLPLLPRMQDDAIDQVVDILLRVIH
jgi:perosamine synthetase